jgi:mannose-6-phosphate isomerase-like protein (cupin superfamily)
LELDDLLVVEERMPPGTSETEHYHARARQFFYVLTGTLTIDVDGQEHTVAAGSGLHVPPGQSHVVANRSRAEATFLAIAAPTTNADRQHI